MHRHYRKINLKLRCSRVMLLPRHTAFLAPFIQVHSTYNKIPVLSTCIFPERFKTNRIEKKRKTVVVRVMASSSNSQILLDMSKLENEGWWRRKGHDLRKFWSWFTTECGKKKFVNYDPAAFRKHYILRPWIVIVRLFIVLLPSLHLYLRFIFSSLLHKVLLRKSKLPSNIVETYSRNLHDILVYLGPAFIKIGQAISQRPDIVRSPILAGHLERLRDEVAHFPTEQAVNLVESEWREITKDSDSFVQIDWARGVVAAASIGQVYTGTVYIKRSVSMKNVVVAERVAVKIQRPNIAQNMALDMHIMRSLASIIGFCFFMVETDLVGIVDEFGESLFMEIDYRTEAKHCEKFKRLYGNIQGIKIPKVYPKFITRHILVQEWIEGKKQPWGEDAARLLDVALRCTVQQLLQDGFFHSDPHNGNLLRTEDGDLAYLDFGMMHSLDTETRIVFIQSLFHMLSGDFSALAMDYLELGFFPPKTDVRPFIPMLEKAYMKACSGMSMDHLCFAKLTKSLAELAFSSPLRLNPYYIHLIRTMSIMEGIGLSLDPNFKVIKQIYPHALNILFRRDDPDIKRVFTEHLVEQKTGRLDWASLEDMLRKSSRISADMETVDEALVLMLKMVTQSSISLPPFLGDILLKELTETIDSAQLWLSLSLTLHVRPNYYYEIKEKQVDLPDYERLKIARRSIREIATLLLSLDKDHRQRRRDILSAALSSEKTILIEQRRLARSSSKSQSPSLNASNALALTSPFAMNNVNFNLVRVVNNVALGTLTIGRLVSSALSEVRRRNSNRRWNSFLNIVDFNFDLDEKADK